MNFIVYDLEENSVIARYNDRQDAERVCEAFNTINEINRRNSNTVRLFPTRYIVVNNGNSSPNSINVIPTITFTTANTPVGSGIWNSYIGNNAPYYSNN
jgi:hypothetical protein